MLGDGIVTVWDARRLPHPLLTFTEKDATADGAGTRGGSGGSGAGAGSTNSNATGCVDHVEFSSSRRGVLAMHEKDTFYIRFLDLHQAQGCENFAHGERFGLGCKVLPGFEDRGIPPQPWDVDVEEETATQGRGKTVRQLMFGKGGKDGFPPLDSDASPSKVMKVRTYSPASFRHYPLKYSVVLSELSAPLSGVSD
ncbi:hypothetical protein AZE42_08904 [Rhizopogon vesiculosus]|uniref:Uncharacterized protein n=1 Tax=Rhizopogon vesiculosus TaxID=180088 RepID=A0A1J8PG47_9AGAM|nr:hypothetical protein AZE42_08904 [Rhizopogon vesiculosus]